MSSRWSSIIGARAWIDALTDGSVRIYGEPELVAALPGWFLPVERDERGGVHPALREPELAVAAAG